MTTPRITSFAVALTALALAIGASPAADATSLSTAVTPFERRAHEPAARPQSPDRRERHAYGWPVKPFQSQHPVRGFFGDPRISNHGASRQFHFGIDISAPNGTPVYATISGTVGIHPLHDTTVLVTAADGTEFSYWHVVPAVRTGQRAVAYRTVLGYVEEPYGHVHFSERSDGRYLNPLRRGALGPYADTTRPWLHRLTADIGVGLVAEVRDETPLAVPRPWHDLPVMPALVHWRLLTVYGRVVRPWETLVDFRLTIPSKFAFDDVWAPGVMQNHVRAPGRYRLRLASGAALSSLPASRYVIEIAAADTRGNAFRAKRAVSLSDS